MKLNVHNDNEMIGTKKVLKLHKGILNIFIILFFFVSFFCLLFFFQEWTIINTYKDPANIMSLCLPRLPTPKIDFSPINNILTYPASILLVQYDDDRLQLLTRYGVVVE